MFEFLALAVSLLRLPDVGWDFRWVNLGVLGVLIGIALVGARRHNQSIENARSNDPESR